jgi:hypothetical protein
MAINYKAQFKSLTEDEWVEVGSQFPACRVFGPKQARQAYQYAFCTEDEGYAVAFGEFCGSYYVWSEK